jgi:hypothetical protein
MDNNEYIIGGASGAMSSGFCLRPFIRSVNFITDEYFLGELDEFTNPTMFSNAPK